MLYRINAVFDDIETAEAAATKIRKRNGVKHVTVLPLNEKRNTHKYPGAFLTASAYPPDFIQYTQYQSFYENGIPVNFYSMGFNEYDMRRGCAMEVYTEGDPSIITSSIINLYGHNPETVVLSA